MERDVSCLLLLCDVNLNKVCSVSNRNMNICNKPSNNTSPKITFILVLKGRLFEGFNVEIDLISQTCLLWSLNHTDLNILKHCFAIQQRIYKFPDVFHYFKTIL